MGKCGNLSLVISNDLLMSDVLRTNELQVWFVAEHVVDTPLVRS
jgi:starvation-inducible DNA-binding protein